MMADDGVSSRATVNPFAIGPKSSGQFASGWKFGNSKRPILPKNGVFGEGQLPSSNIEFAGMKLSYI
jgi:hypothetical protein